MPREPLKAWPAILALASLLVLAGCLGAAQGATARGSLSPADQAAGAWDPGAELARIVGVEGTFGFAWMGGFAGAWSGHAAWWGGGATHWERSAEDPRVGDGRCEVWVYRYVAPNRDEAFVVVVDRNGTVVRQGPDEREDDDVPVGEWRIDSDRALAIAKEANQGLREGLGGQRFSVVEVLGREPARERGAWLVAGGGGGPGGGGGGFVLLDAVSGEVLRSEGGFGTAARP